MKKKIGILLAVALICTCLIAFAAISLADEADGQTTITISYVKDQNTTSDTSTLDTVAYANGKQVVGVGEKFTLPTTADSSYAGKEGFQVIWYTEDGHTYKAGEEVSFDKDTRLYRCVAKEVYTMPELNYAMCNEGNAAVLMADITTDLSISVLNQGQSVLILNGYTINITRNGNIMGSQRSGKHIYGEGTINAVNPNGKLGEYAFFQNQSHGYNGSANRTVIGRDVTINAPNFWLGSDGDGSYNNHYPWTRIYGTVKLYGFYSITNLGNRAPFIEVYESANVTITGPRLYKDSAWRANGKYSFNGQSFELNIYGGTFNLPAEAAERSFWTNDYLETYTEGSNTYYNYGLNENTKDKINIYGGSFALPDNATPAIAEYLKVDSLGTIPSGGNGILAKANDSTYHVAYGVRPAYKLVFTKYADTYTKLAVTDYVDGSLTGTYYYTYTTKEIKFIDYNDKEVVSTIADEIKVYELNAETQEYTETDKFALDYGMNGSVIFSNDYVKSNGKLYSFEANGVTYQTVVSADCEHDFTGAPVDANCQHSAYADYNCSICGYNVHFSWGERQDHDYVLGEHIAATTSSLGSKTYTCSDCGTSVTRAYSVDPTNLDVKVTLRHDDDSFEDVTVKSSDIFEFSTSGVGEDLIYTVSAIKAFGENSIRNIYGIEIPCGILYFSIATHNYEKYNNVEYGVAVLTVAENATTNILNIGNLRRLEKIVIGKNTDVTFGASCSWYSPNNEQRKTNILSTIDMSAGNHKVNFVSACFEGRDTITSVIFGENAEYSIGYRTFYNGAISKLEFPATSTYTFTGTYAFYGNDMTELAFPDNLDFTFPQNTFENCANLASITFGENAKYEFGNYCFLYNAMPKLVLAPNSEYIINAHAFVSATITELDMSAGNMIVTLNGSAFNFWINNKHYSDKFTTVNFGENSTYTIGDHALHWTSIEELKLAPSSTYVFKRYCVNGDTNKTGFLSLDASADNINVTFESDSFRERSALATLKLNGKNSTYRFYGTSFYNTSISELVLGEGSTYSFDNAFNGSTPITKIDASADGINVSFNGSAFESKTMLAVLMLNGKNGTYSFANNSFKNTIIRELVLGDGSTYTFTNGSFSGVSSIERIDASANNLTVDFKDYIFNGKSNLSVLDISGENSTYNFGRESFKNTIIEELKFGQGSTYTFGYKAFDGNAVLATLDFTAPNVTATFGSEAFNGRSSIKYLAFGENSTYTIGNYAFNNNRAENPIVFYSTSTFTIGKRAFYAGCFESIVFEDDVNVTFTDNEAFQDCTNTKYLYLGRNFQLDNYPFKRLKDLEKLVIMDGVKFKDDQQEEWFFEYLGSSNPATPFVVYNHSTEMTFPRGTFNECDGIILYTVTEGIGTNGEVFRSCSDGEGYKGWTVILGIPHALVQGSSAPTCTIIGGTNWIGADCDCGIVYREELNIKVYENKHNIKEDTAIARVDTYTIEPIPALGHQMGDFITIVYANGYLAPGCAQYNCARCLNEEGYYEEETEPLMVSLGYSVSEFGDTVSMTQGYYINEEAFLAYKVVCPNLTYGIISIGNASGEGVAPLTVNEGVITNSVVGYHYNFGTFINNFFDIKVNGITDKTANSTIAFCAYIYDGSKFGYVDNGTIAETVIGVSYNSIVTSQE